MHDQRTFLHKCAELVKPGGFFFLSSIARTPEAWLSNILVGEYLLGIVPKGTHEWEFLIDQKTVSTSWVIYAVYQNELALLTGSLKSLLSVFLFKS